MIGQRQYLLVVEEVLLHVVVLAAIGFERLHIVEDVAFVVLAQLFTNFIIYLF